MSCFRLPSWNDEGREACLLCFRAPVTVDETDVCCCSLFGPAMKQKDKQAAELTRDGFCLLAPLFPFELIRAERESTDGGRRHSHNRALLSRISLPPSHWQRAGSACLITASSALTPFICVKVPPLEGWQRLRQQVRPTRTPQLFWCRFQLYKRSRIKQRWARCGLWSFLFHVEETMWILCY